MQIILDKTPPLPLKRKHKNRLKLILIVTEIIGILALVWYLRMPLYEKYFTTQPKAYSVTQMNPTKRYVVAQGDYITGQSINPTIVVLLRQGEKILEKAKLKTDANGNWYYQIPNITLGVKTITIGELNQAKEIQSIKSYKIRITSNNTLAQNKITKKIFDSFVKSSAIQNNIPYQSAISNNPVFYAEFEYDPETAQLTSLGEGTTSGRLKIPLQEKPASASGKLDYKVEIEKDGNTKSSWGVMELIPNGKYRFKFEAEYLPNTLISVYLKNGNLIWKRVLY